METKERFTQEELKEFEKLLEEKRLATTQELEELRSQLDELNKASTSYSDDSARHEQQNVLRRIIRRQEKKLQAQEQALLRIENGTYGICRETGNLISKERLMAKPTATKSMAAKQRETRRR